MWRLLACSLIVAYNLKDLCTTKRIRMFRTRDDNIHTFGMIWS